MSRSIRGLNFAFCAVLLASVVAAGAEEAPTLHPGSWPIRHWRNHQPRRSDLTPAQNRKIDHLYSRLKEENPPLIAPDFRQK